MMQLKFAPWHQAEETCCRNEHQSRSSMVMISGTVSLKLSLSQTERVQRKHWQSDSSPAGVGALHTAKSSIAFILEQRSDGVVKYPVPCVLYNIDHLSPLYLPHIKPNYIVFCSAANKWKTARQIMYKPKALLATGGGGSWGLCLNLKMHHCKMYNELNGLEITRIDVHQNDCNTICCFDLKCTCRMYK